MNSKTKRNWYPISSLPMFVDQIGQIIDALEDNYSLFYRTKENPESLNDELINKATTLFENNVEYILLYQEQLNRWKQESLNSDQKQELDVFGQGITEAQNLNAKLLTLTKHLKSRTINKILEKDDFELGLDFLSGETGKHD